MEKVVKMRTLHERVCPNFRQLVCVELGFRLKTGHALSPNRQKTAISITSNH